jgi:hypothetical protein
MSRRQLDQALQGRASIFMFAPRRRRRKHRIDHLRDFRATKLRRPVMKEARARVWLRGDGGGADPWSAVRCDARRVRWNPTFYVFKM